MKLDTTHLRYLSENDFRVLTAVDPLLDMATNKKGRNRKQKPSCRPHPLDQSNLQVTLRKRCTLNKRACKGRINITATKCEMSVPRLGSILTLSPDDGYRLSYSGHDYLALKAFSKKGVIYAVGPQVGTGKESDVFTCTGDDDSGKKLILKIHRSVKVLCTGLIVGSDE